MVNLPSRLSQPEYSYILYSPSPGYVMLVSQWLVFYQSQKRSKAVPNHPFGKYDCKYKILGASISDGKDKTRKPSAILVSIDDKDGSGWGRMRLE